MFLYTKATLGGALHDTMSFKGNIIYSTYPDAGYSDRLGPSGKFVESCLEIAGYRIKYSTVLWLLEL